MRHETARKFLAPMARTTPTSSVGPSFDLGAFLTITLLILFTTPVAFAEPADRVSEQVVSSPPAALAFTQVDTRVATVLKDPVISATPVNQNISDRFLGPNPALAALLAIRSHPVEAPTSLTTDEALAIAVAQGNNPDLERKNPFRKRSRDLFRTERPVTIGNADMLLRLRLRAKLRRAMSFEVRF